MKIIPAVDLKSGQCVRLYQGDYNISTIYSNDPIKIARQFSSLAVADLHVVDLDGARSGESVNRAAVRSIVDESGLSVQVGGGIRSRDDVATWLDYGVARCVVGSVAVREPGKVNEWIDEFGADSIVLALDVRIDNKGVPVLAVNGWTEDSGVSLWQCLDQYLQVGNQHVLCTDVARDGALAGPNLQLYGEILNRYPELQLQASGGVRNIQDLEALREMGAPAAISGRALLDGAISSSEVSSFRQNA